MVLQALTQPFSPWQNPHPNFAFTTVIPSSPPTSEGHDEELHSFVNPFFWAGGGEAWGSHYAPL